MNLKLNHVQAMRIVQESGWDGFVKWIEEQTQLKYFSCSQSWYRDPKYVCKLKGANGDTVIDWIKAQWVSVSKEDYARFSVGRQVMALNDRQADKKQILVTGGEILAHYGDVLLIEKHY